MWLLCPLHCSKTAGVSAPLSKAFNFDDGGDESGLSFGGETDNGVKTSFGVDPWVAFWEGEEGGFVERVK